MRKKVLDTNVFMQKHIEGVFESFPEPTEVIIPHVVLKELDKFKTGFESKNEYARAATRFLDKLRKQGNIQEGVMYGDHKVRIHIVPEELDLDKPDYQIIRTAKESNAELVSLDINERVVADAVGVQAESFDPEQVDVNKLYTGYRDILIKDEELEEWMKMKQIRGNEYELLHNEFVVLEDSMGGLHLGIYKHNKEAIVPLQRHYEAWGIKPKKDKYGERIIEQIFTMHALLDPEIQFFTAIGPSGCGKTILTMACALEQVLNNDTYNKITVMRPLVAVGDDIGYLPGDKLEKLEPWMASTFDALDYLLDGYESKDMHPQTSTKEKVYELIGQGRLELEAMAHVRGRSLPNQILIIDDAQNLTAQQATTIITRAGEGTKVIFLGDLSEKQIDNHRLTPNSNGLAYVIDRLKGNDIVAHITLQTVVRSRLAQLGVELL